MGARERNLVVPMMDWTPTAHEAPQPNSRLSFPTFSRVQTLSKTTGKPRRSSPLAGPALSSDRSVVSLNETAHAPRTGSSLSVEDADRLLSIRSKSSLGLSRPASIVSLYPPSPRPYSSRHRPSTAPTSSSQIDMQSIKKPPSAHSPAKITRSEWVSLSTSQGSRGVASGSSFVSDSSGSRVRCMSTALAGPSTHPASVILEVEAEAEVGVKDDPDDTQSRTSAMLYPKLIPNPAVPLDNSWYVANEYSEIPKFSRLGLAGSNVVMPVSAKERKRQISQRGSVASFRSNTSGRPASRGSEFAGITNSAGMNLTRYSSSSSMTSDSKGRNGTIKSPRSNNRDTVADVFPQKEPTASLTHKPEWLIPPRTHSQSRGTSLPSHIPTFGSAASSTSSLPLATAPHSGASSTLSVVSSATTHISVDESAKAAVDDQYQHHPKDISPMELKNKLVKRKSVLAMVKSWRKPQSGQRKHLSSLNDFRDEHGVPSVSSECIQSGERDSGVLHIDPLLSSKINDVKSNVDVVVTPAPKSRSESTIQAVPGNGKQVRRFRSMRKIWNALTRKTLRT